MGKNKGRRRHTPSKKLRKTEKAETKTTKIARIRVKKRKKRKEIKICTWNIRTMLVTGKMQEIATEIMKYHVQIAALQELRWKEQGEIDKGEYIILYSGDTKKGKNGVGFIIDKETKSNIMDFKPINSRMAYIQINSKPHNITIINVYAPTEDTDEETKDEFYDKLEETINEIQSQNVLLVVGDFNAQIGKEKHNEEVAGKHTIHDITNNNGRRMCNLAANTNMIISSTKYQHKVQHKITWKHPDPQKKGSQIDHVMIRRRQQNTVKDVRTYRGACADTDHYMVVTTMKQKINRNKTNKSTKRKWDIDKFKNRGTREEYTNKLKRIEEEEENTQEGWEKIKTSIEKAAEEVIGWKTIKKRNNWFDLDCKNIIERKRKERLNWIRNGKSDDREKYNEIRRQCNKTLREKKKRWINDKLNEIELKRRNNDSKEFYKMIKSHRTWKRSRLRSLKNKQGSLQHENKEKNKIWIEHFSKQTNNDKEVTIAHNIENEPVQEPTKEEVEEATRKIKNNKAPGRDGINGELIKYGGNTLHNKLYELILQVWREESMPNDWKQGLIIPLYKKGDRQKVENYRGITLLSNAYKIFSSILNNRIKTVIKSKIGEYQCGFTEGRSTTDAIHRIRRIMETAYEYGISIEMLFVDFQQAFDTISRKKLLEAMRTIGIPSKLIKLVAMTINKITAKVKTEEGETDEFEIKTGVRQGDVLSSTLFNIILEYIIRKLNISDTIINKETQIIAYADDVVIISRSKKKLIETCRKLIQESSEANMKINVDKTKYMKLQKHQKTAPGTLTVDNLKFEGVKSFKYLGVEIDSSNSMENDIALKQQAANRAYFANQFILKSKLLTKCTKLRIYKTLIRPTMTYGGETMCMTKKNEEQLRRTERQMLRRIFGPVKTDENTYRRKYNAELLEETDGEDIVKYIKSLRIRWLGHIRRREEAEQNNKILRWKPCEKRGKGRPKTRWLDEAEKDLKKMGINKWWELVKDRNTWKKIVREAKQHHQL